MKKACASILLFLAAVAPSAAFAETPGSEVSLTAGYRKDDLNWNIAGVNDVNGNFTNVLSEVAWSNLEIWQVKGAGRAYLGKIYLRGYADYGIITSGENQDSDFSLDNRGGEFSRTNNNSDSGNVWDISGGIGYLNRITFKGGSSIDLIPVIGASVHRQNLRITDAVQTISTPGFTPPLGPFGGLDSSYDAQWAGPWAGVDLAYRIGGFTLTGTFEYHYAWFDAEADWNLRGDFQHPKSFEDTAIGRGFVSSAGLEYNITDRWSIDANVDYQDWRAKDGTDRTFFANGTTFDTPFNVVNWRSKAVMAGLNYKF